LKGIGVVCPGGHDLSLRATCLQGAPSLNLKRNPLGSRS